MTFVSLYQHNRRRFVPASCSSPFSSAVYASTSETSNHDTNRNKEIYSHREKTLRENSKLSLAPMMEYTDRHFRHLIRLISDKTLLYTEMVAANAIAHEREDAVSTSGTFNPSYLLRFLGQGHNSEGASVLQLGGSDPDQLYLAAKTVYEFNQMHNQNYGEDSQLEQKQPIYCDYTALNLNCGCPSSKVAGKGCFGAALMSEPDLVRQLATSMHEGCEGTMPITVKCRIGTDDGYVFTKERYLEQSEEEEYNSLKNFVLTVAEGGVVTDFQVHARIAVLGKGYSPADNRKVPPLRYHHVKRLAEEFPELNISLNGGVETLLGVKELLDDCGALEGVMVGRGLAANPWAFAMADEVLYDDSSARASNKVKHRMEVLEAYGRHADYEEALWDPVKIRRFMTKAISPLFAGEPNAKRYRIALDDIASLPKQLMNEQGSGKMDASAVRNVLKGQPPLSELIMDIATTHLSDEVLYRSARESYERMLYEQEEMDRKHNVVATVAFSGNGTSLIKEWQDSRKEEAQEETYENSA
jgi:tRNA-dihydrouridine synthase A